MTHGYLQMVGVDSRTHIASGRTRRIMADSSQPALNAHSTPVAMPVLRLFGSPTLENDDGRPIGGGASQRHRIALLALLARSRGGYTRDKLVALLWPDSSA